MKLVTNKFRSGGLNKKHVVATWNLGNHLSICLQTQGNQEKPVWRWPVTGPSEYRLLASSPASKVKTAVSSVLTFRYKKNHVSPQPTHISTNSQPINIGDGVWSNAI